MGVERDILTRYRTIAVVGISTSPQRPSHRVARYLKEQGYSIIPSGCWAGLASVCCWWAPTSSMRRGAAFDRYPHSCYNWWCLRGRRFG